MSHFDIDLHLHLYGALAAEDLWELGKTRLNTHRGRLDWFAQEFKLAYGREAHYQAYWERPSGLELLRKDYEIKSGVSFAQFQASFNLIIALCPIQPDETTVLEKILARDLRLGLRHAEYRTLLPASFNSDALATFLQRTCGVVLATEAESGGSFSPRLALSLPRSNDLLLPLYTSLKGWLTANPLQAKAISAIDFCGYEEKDPPQEKRSFFRQVHADNLADPKIALAILYHVGESFSEITPHSATRWVWQAAAFGAHRLGHAMAAAVSAEIFRGKVFRESVKEKLAHLSWLKSEQGWLKERGYEFDFADWQQQWNSLHSAPSEKLIEVPASEALLEDLTKLQEAVLKELAERKTAVEVCPTSNLRIGQIREIHHHPLVRFLNSGVAFCIGTDDPGLFGNSLASEEAFCRDAFKLSDKTITMLSENAHKFQSERLSGRAEGKA